MVFFTFEADFRFRDEAQSPEQMIPLSQTVAVGDGSSSTGVSNPSRARGEFFYIPTKDDGPSSPSQEVADLVRYINLASREKRGNLLWMTWQPGNAGSKVARKTCMKSGAMLIAWTQEAARRVLTAMENGTIECGHFDVMLKRWLFTSHEEAQASYVYPPIGNYGSHISSCETQKGYENNVRHACWNEAWCCAGTRVSEDAKMRRKWCMRWNENKAGVWLFDFPQDMDNVKPWTTFRPAAAASSVEKPATKRRRREQSYLNQINAHRQFTEDESEVIFRLFQYT